MLRTIARPVSRPAGVSRPAVLPAVLATLLLGGCGPGDAPAASTVALRDTLADGRVLVRYASPPAVGPAAIAPDLRIGSLDGSDASAFGDVRGIAEGPDGTVYVLDYQAAELRAFEPDGSFRRTVARRGEGPGELMEPNGMLVGPGGRLWIKDHGHGDIIGLAPDSGEIARHPMVVRGYGYVWDGDVDDEGRFWKPWGHSVEERAPGVRPEPGLQESASRRYYMRYDPRSETRDSIYLGEATYRSLMVERGNGRMFLSLPFTTGTHVAVDPDGHVWSAWSGAYEIARMDEAGDTVLVIEVSAETPPVTAEDRESFLARFRESMEPEVFARIEAGISDHFPERKPVLEGLSVDRAGRLWVRRTPGHGETPVFDVFDRTGEHLASLRVGAALVQYIRPVVGRSAVYGLIRDSLDVPYVVRLPLPETLAAPGEAGD